MEKWNDTQLELQKMTSLSKTYRANAEKASLDREESMKMVWELQRKKDELEAVLAEKEKTITRNEASSQSRIKDLTDSLVSTRASNNELMQTVGEYQRRAVEADAVISESKSMLEVMRGENASLRKQHTQDSASTEELKSLHHKEVEHLKGILEDYSSSLAEMRPLIEESHSLTKIVVSKGYSASLTNSFSALLEEIIQYKASEAQLKKEHASLVAAQNKANQDRAAAERQLVEYKLDLQKLNDFLTKEKQQLMVAQSEGAALKESVLCLQQERSAAAKERQKLDQLRGVNTELNAAMKLSLEKSRNLESKVVILEQTVVKLEAKNIETSSHVWNLAEDLKQAQRNNQELNESRQQLEEQLSFVISQHTTADNMIKSLTGNLQNSVTAQQSTVEETRLEMLAFKVRTTIRTFYQTYVKLASAIGGSRCAAQNTLQFD